MSEFKGLEQAYLAAVKASAEGLCNSVNDMSASDQLGFGEASQSFAYTDSEDAIGRAEAACLDYRAESSEELLPKIEFILGQMRELTDETEEFDAYAKQLLSDFKSFAANT